MTTATQAVTSTAAAGKARAARLADIRAGAYVFDDGTKVMLLIPDGFGPADASAIARERLGHDGPLDLAAFRAAGPGKGVYVTYQAIDSDEDAP